MARMVASQRLELGDKMVEAWTAAGQGNHRSCLFVQDMLFRMRAGKTLTPKQRQWFDSAVASDPPDTSLNGELVARLREAKIVKGMEKHMGVLEDFAYRASRGFSFTEKQQNFMNSLLAQAENYKAHGPWMPSTEERKTIETVVGLCKRYSIHYLSNRPGLLHALQQATQWLMGATPYLDKRDAEKIMEACKTERFQMSRFANKYPVGALVQHIESGVLCTVLSAPHPDAHGRAVINVLMGDSIKEAPMLLFTNIKP